MSRSFRLCLQWPAIPVARRLTPFLAAAALHASLSGFVGEAEAQRRPTAARPGIDPGFKLER